MYQATPWQKKKSMFTLERVAHVQKKLCIPALNQVSVTKYDNLSRQLNALYAQSLSLLLRRWHLVDDLLRKFPQRPFKNQNIAPME